MVYLMVYTLLCIMVYILVYTTFRSMVCTMIYSQCTARQLAAAGSRGPPAGHQPQSVSGSGAGGKADWVHLGTLWTRGGELAAAEHPHVLG